MRIVWRIVWRIVVVVGALTFLSSGVRLLSQAHGRCKHVELGRRYFMVVSTCFDEKKWSNAKAVGNTGWAMSGAAAGWLSVTLGMLGLGVVVVGLADFALHRLRGRRNDDRTASEPPRLVDERSRRAPAAPPSPSPQPLPSSNPPSDADDDDSAESLRDAGAPAPPQAQPAAAVRSASTTGETVPAEAAITAAVAAGQDLAARLASSIDEELPTELKRAAILLGTLIEVGAAAVRTHAPGPLHDSELAKLAAFAEENGLPGERIARLVRERRLTEAVAVASAALRRVAALHRVTLPEELAMQLPLWMAGSHE
jgi:hypothetical protein